MEIKACPFCGGEVTQTVEITESGEYWMHVAKLEHKCFSGFVAGYGRGLSLFFNPKDKGKCEETLKESARLQAEAWNRRV